MAAARWASALWHALAWAIFGAAYVAAVVFVSRGPARQLTGATCSAAPARGSAYIGATVGEIGFLRGFWLDGSRRMAWLEDYAASLTEHADLPRRAPCGRHSLRARPFAYPGTTRVLDDVNLD